LIRACYTQTLAKGSAVPAVASTDSVRLSAADGSHQVVDRQFVQIIQTPQTFSAHVLKAAFQQDYQDVFTDEATVVEAAGGVVHLIAGDYSNIKVTRPIDLLMAERILEERNSL
jgi:2-C-methyl-D-erythritol 4-phosphate cytidylyltransferase